MKLIFFILLLPTFGLAAPIPGTSSSHFAGKHPGLYYSNQGFSIHSEKTNWIQQQAPLENQNILAFYKSPNKNPDRKASLTVRIDKLNKKLKLDSYVKNWKKDYIKFGMKIVNSKKVKLGKNKAFMIDLLGPKKNKFLRQLVFLKGHKAAILTCRTARKGAKRNIPSCNQMFRNFTWL